ncbi:MAG: PilZ domain-containing protein [Planctomycetota bacterium]|jgi:hypothetical protein
MLHDGVLESVGTSDRRRGDRLPLPAEITLFWHHDPDCTMRYRVLDASDGGFRLRSTTPMLEGMTGTVLRLLPEGTPVDRSVCIAWCRPDEPQGGYQVGLRTLG